MTACPHCGQSLELPPPAKHRTELERQTGNPSLAAGLVERAKQCHADHGNAVRLAGTNYIAWRGYVWGTARLRKDAICELTGAQIVAGAFAWRNLSEMRDRNLRVSGYAWRAL